uniref:Uncharacterized protein n=1 Tax=Tanacetum cinerariifolium TaxID=118510 RepID=A0A699J5Z3_TANCI|nr:hypothetical protein [Tanacetum cinerariifolium]
MLKLDLNDLLVSASTSFVSTIAKFFVDEELSHAYKYFVEYTGIDVKHFKDTLLQHMGNVKKSVAERTRHQRQYDRMKAVERNQKCKMTTVGQGMIQMLMMQISDPYMTKSQWLRPVTHHYLPKRREYVFAKPGHMIASSESRNSSKNMPKFSSNDMAHNHYLDEARKKTQEKDMNSKTSVMSSARFQSTIDGRKEVNSCAKIQSHKTRNRNKPVDQKSHTQKPGRQIFTGHRWIPTGKLFASCTSKVDSEPPHGSNVDIPNIHECKQTLDVSAGTSINVQKEQSLDLSTEVPSTDTIVMTSLIESESLVGLFFDEYFNGENQVVSKSSAVTTTDASDKRQQQPYSTSSTSTLATTVTVDGNFDL